MDKYEVCTRCNGEGEVWPTWANGKTASEFAEDFDDEEREDIREGRYNIVCPKCDGKRVTANKNYVRAAVRHIMEDVIESFTRWKNGNEEPETEMEQEITDLIIDCVNAMEEAANELDDILDRLNR